MHRTPKMTLHVCVLFNAPSLFVCLFPIQIGAVARCATKRAMHAEGRLECALRRPACDNLPCDRRTCEVFLGQGTKTSFLFAIMWSPVTVRNTLKCSKTAEESPGCAPRDRCTTTCPVAAKIVPDILGQGTKTPFYTLFGIMQIPLAFRAVQNIAKMDARTPGWLDYMLRTSRHFIVVDCRECTNKQTGAFIVRCPVWEGFTLP